MNEILSSTLPEQTALWQQTLAWQPTPQQQAQFQQLYAHILEGNRQFNLTRITEPEEFWEKHLWDSLRGIKPWLEEKEAREQVDPATDSTRPLAAPLKVIDIGTGAGFPGIPVAIVRPNWSITLLDSTRKKVLFLERLIEALQLPNAATVVDRVEQVGQQQGHRQRYDLALIRAVAAAAVCAEYALPLLKLGGMAVLYRGQWTGEETTALAPVVEQLGGKIETVEPFETPLTHGERHCLYLRKVAPTPADYPRAVGMPTQKPLS